MLSRSEQAFANLEAARVARAAGRSYREIGRMLGLTSNQLGHIRRALKREKASRTRLRKARPQASDRDLPVGQTVLSPGLRRTLVRHGFRTLGDLADRLADPEFRGFESLADIGPHRAQMIRGVLDHFGLLPGPSDLQAAVERLFPELRAAPGERESW